jgi:hypothetical protein
VPSVLLLAVACASTPESAPAAAQFSRERQPSIDRKIIRSGELTVTVNAPLDSLADVQRIIEGAGGFLEWSNTADAKVSLRCRVPAEKLDTIMDAFAALGSQESRSVSATDVTEQHADLSTRLKNDIALRDRLKHLLDRAKSVEDVLAIEKELTRIQSEVETMQASLDRLDSQVALSELTVTLQRRQILGPLGYVGYGLWWAISKLFVIR